MKTSKFHTLALVTVGLFSVISSGCDFGGYNERATQRSIEIREKEEEEERKRFEKEAGTAVEGEEEMDDDQ